MRQTISGLVAAIAVVTASAVPAMACGGGGLFQSSCSPCGQAYVSPCAQPEVYVPPAPVYPDCNSCGGWAHERLPDPVQQYYYVNQGPSYTGPGDSAPEPTYQEGAGPAGVPIATTPIAMATRIAMATKAPATRPSTVAHPHFRPWHGPMGYRYSMRPSIRYGYAPHRYGYAPRHAYVPHYSLPPRQFYAPQRSLRYGAPLGVPHQYGYHEHMRRYN